MKSKTLTNLQKRLERLELDHLRKLAADLHERLVAAETAADSAYESAHFWQQHAMDLQQALYDGEFATSRCVGITKSGEMSIVRLPQ